MTFTAASTPFLSDICEAVARAVLRPLSGQPAIAVLMATIGMASIIRGGVEAVWGG